MSKDQHTFRQIIRRFKARESKTLPDLVVLLINIAINIWYTFIANALIIWYAYFALNTVLIV